MTNHDKLKQDLDELILIVDYYIRKVIVAARQMIDELEKIGRNDKC